jgi:hypothetical protein
LTRAGGILLLLLAFVGDGSRQCSDVAGEPAMRFNKFEVFNVAGEPAMGFNKFEVFNKVGASNLRRLHLLGKCRSSRRAPTSDKGVKAAHATHTATAQGAHSGLPS